MLCIRRLAALLCLCLGVVSAPVFAAGSPFALAFGAEKIDFAASKQFRDGQAAPVDAAVVKKTLGFPAKSTNYEIGAWTAGDAKVTGETTFAFLLALTEPVPVGSMLFTPAETLNRTGVKDAAEVWYLKPDAKLPPDANDATQWLPVKLLPGQQYLQLYTFPNGTKTQAFLYKTTRFRGPAVIQHWHFYQQRLGGLTPGARGYCEGGFLSTDPEALPRGEGWKNVVGTQKPRPVSETTPTWFILHWPREVTLDGLTFTANASTYRLYTYTGAMTSNLGAAPAAEWRLLDVKPEREAAHVSRFWKYWNRWFALNGLSTRALKVEILGCDGDTAWIEGLSALTALGEAPPPTFSQSDPLPPFRIPYRLPLAGEAALALDSADGKRVRNIFAQTTMEAGPAEYAWDLKDGSGNYVKPGKYRLKGIVAPLLELRYQMTPYPNLRNFWPDRTPWLTGHSEPNGWLSDHSQNWAVATRGDKLYFGAPMAEAGVSFMECDLDGKKLWGKHDFDPWKGVDRIAADAQAVYIASDNRVFRMDPDTHVVKKIFNFNTRPDRRGMFSAMTARDGKVYLAFAADPMFDNATTSRMLDAENCLPKAGADLARALRMSGSPPGAVADPLAWRSTGNGNLYLESTSGTAAVQYNVVAFKELTPIGSLALPLPPATECTLRISLLKPDAPYPPRVQEEGDWTPLEITTPPGRWTVLPAPPNAMTRALRFTFIHPTGRPTAKAWYGRLEGLKILNRRFQNLITTATGRVNSGSVNAGLVWDAQRTKPLGEDNPGLMTLEWATPQQLSGVALKEVDGARTLVDVWEGPEGAPIDMNDAKNWRNVASYTQQRRIWNYKNDNYAARYLDGYIEFKEAGRPVTLTTRALRLRVVEQWFDNADGRCQRLDGVAKHATHFSQQPTYTGFDTRRCRIFGVAPVQYLGGEPPIDTVAYRRIEVYDGNTGDFIKDLPVRVGWGMEFGPQGDLFVAAADHQSVLKVDKETGASSTVLANVTMSRMTIAPDGSIVLLTSDPEGAIKVYSPDGKLLRAFGKAGMKAGTWDPLRIGKVHTFIVDKNGSLWMMEWETTPRRILQYELSTGKLLKEILGNTLYGGGGTLNRYDKSRAYYGRTEFNLDWKNYTGTVRGLLDLDIDPSGLVAFRRGNFNYLVTTPIRLHGTQGHAVVFLYDRATGAARQVAAFGDATSYTPLRNADVLALLPDGAAPKAYSFIWSDLNGNGAVEPAEVQFTLKTEVEARGINLGPFDMEMGCSGTGSRYAVTDILPNGTPRYAKTPIPAGFLKLANGNYFALHSQYQGQGGTENYVVAPNGEKVWGYPATGGVAGLNLPPWTPGQVTNQFCVIGHEIAEKGELGEFLVVSTNTGQWHIWTADGLLAGNVLMHKTDPRSQFLSMPEATPGMRVDPLTASQEHFNGFFTKHEPDGKYYAVMGFNHISVLEVQGLEKFRRVNVDVTVTQADIERMQAWDAQRTARGIQARTSEMTARALAKPPVIDGKRDAAEWPDTAALLDGSGRATFTLGYDAQNLYLCWTGKNMGPLQNGGSDFHTFFKTGACLDFLLGADPQAPAQRTKPALGDLRLLVAYVNGKPRVTLYQPVAPGARPQDGWRTFTEANGETRFDRVVEIPARVAMSGKETFTVEVAVPLASLGLRITNGLRLKADWGILTSPDGIEVKERVYWSNKLATGTSDESTEARLEPHLWGFVTFE